MVMPRRRRIRNSAGISCLAAALIAAAAPESPAHAGLSSAGVGRLGKTPTLCFAGDALSARPERVRAVLEIAKDFEAIANIRFKYIGACPPSKPTATGNDYFDGDIRIALAGTNIDLNARSPLPGKGCTMTEAGSGDFAGFPVDAPKWRPCIYNVRLGVERPNRANPYRNQVLHEIGHALGLFHEHQRTDVDFTVCHEVNFGGTSDGFLTTYDRYSVMHYEFLTCGINGNYACSGLSGKDAMAIHILYPEDDRAATFFGKTVVRENQAFWLVSEWKIRGAFLPYVLKSAQWTIDGKTASDKPDLAVTLPPGEHPFVYTYRDFLDRQFTQRGILRVLTTDDYTRRISGPVAARAALQ